MNNYRNNNYSCNNRYNQRPRMDQTPMNSCPAEQRNITAPLAMAYVPWQHWSDVMCASEGLKAGTIFPELVFPFYGCRPDCNNKRGGYR